MEQNNYDFPDDEVISSLTDEMNEQDFMAGVFPEVQLQPGFKVEPKPAGAAEDEAPKHTIADKVANLIMRFVFIKRPSVYLLLGMWAVGTYLHEDFDFFGYLFAYSAEPQSGKSRLLEVLDLLVRNSTGLLVSPSQAILFRVVGHTQLLDEVDSWTNAEDLRGILNACFKKGGSVPRVDKRGDNGFEPRFFKAYCPRALAGIGSHILTSATRDRTFMLRMERRTDDEVTERFRSSKAKEETLPIRAEIEAWARENREAVQKLYDEEEFAYLESFSDRTIDIASPLAAITEVMFKGSPQLEMVRRALADALEETRGEVQQSDDQPIFRDLLRLAEGQDEPLQGTSTELAEKCGMETNEVCLITQALRKHGFKTKSVRKQGEGDPRKRYELSKQRLAEILERYGGSKEPA
jgi:hypothetical protein